jgi:hypothetical protein
MDSFGAESGFEALSQNTFKIRFFDLFRFQNVYPLNNCLTCGVFLEQLSIYYAFYTAKNTVHPIFGPKTILVLA